MVNAYSTELRINVIENDDTGTIFLNGRFVFYAHPDFTAAYNRLLRKTTISSIVIDFENVKHLDSSALGMLLVLHDRALDWKKSLTLCQPSRSAAAMFDIANFHQKFVIRQCH